MSKFVFASGIIALAFGAATSSACAAPCPSGYVQTCYGGDKMHPPACKCVPEPPSSATRGKSEIKKKNVPQVKPNKSPGPND